VLEGTCEYDARAEAPTLVHVTTPNTEHEASPRNTTSNGHAFNIAPRRRRSTPQATGVRSIPHQYGVALWLFFEADGELLVEHEHQDPTDMVTSQVTRATYGR
jgi:hypothetical protein